MPTFDGSLARADVARGAGLDLSPRRTLAIQLGMTSEVMALNPPRV